MSYLYILLTILFTVYGQIVIKWQVCSRGTMPGNLHAKILYLYHFLFNAWILSALIAAIIASITWIAAMAKLPLSYAYPFMSLSFILVLLLSAALFYEPLNWQKILGTLLIVLGVWVTSQGHGN